jgi:hypothetical protein
VRADNSSPWRQAWLLHDTDLPAQGRQVRREVPRHCEVVRAEASQVAPDLRHARHEDQGLLPGRRCVVCSRLTLAV